MHCISLAILSRLSQFPSPVVGTNLPCCFDALLNTQSLNQFSQAHATCAVAIIWMGDHLRRSLRVIRLRTLWTLSLSLLTRYTIYTRWQYGSHVYTSTFLCLQGLAAAQPYYQMVTGYTAAVDPNMLSVHMSQLQLDQNRNAPGQFVDAGYSAVSYPNGQWWSNRQSHAGCVQKFSRWTPSTGVETRCFWEWPSEMYCFLDTRAWIIYRLVLPMWWWHSCVDSLRLMHIQLPRTYTLEKGQTLFCSL